MPYLSIDSVVSGVTVVPMDRWMVKRVSGGDGVSAIAPGADTPAQTAAAAGAAGALGHAGASVRDHLPTSRQARKSSTDYESSLDRQAQEADQDALLMLRYQQGDNSAFELLYRRFQPRLYRFLLSATGNEAVALDLYQDIWTRVVKAKDSYQPSARLATWLFTIGRNCLNDYYRAINKPLHDTVSLETEDVLGNVDQSLSVAPLQPDEIVALMQNAGALSLALDTLPPAQRDAVLLRYAAGMTIADMAQLENEKPETIKSRLRYALPKLRQELKQYGQGSQVD